MKMFKRPTAHADVNAVLAKLLAGARAALGERLVGLYLYGSLAGGDFDPATSDVDFVAVTAGALPPADVAALAALHQRLAGEPGWGGKLEGSYIAQAALRRYDPDDQTAWPTLNEREFYLAPHGWDWVIQRHVLRQQGVVVAGPPLAPLIDPVAPDELRRAVRELLRSWWAPMLAQPARLSDPAYQAYAILSMCRALHAIDRGTIVSKPRAAEWARRELGEPLAGSIARALAWRPGQPLDELAAALELLRRALARAER